MNDSTFLQRVVLRNYRSIAACDVHLRPLTFLVGPNGSGKSNFVDALRFVTDALSTSLDYALRERAGISEVRRRSGGHPTHFGIRLELRLPDGGTGVYAFRIGARPRGGYEVQQEECILRRAVALNGGESFFHVEGGIVRTSAQLAPAVLTDRLYLVLASGLPEFRPVYEALSHMGFYNLNPDRIRDLQSPDPGDVLARDGSNITSVLNRMADQYPVTKERIELYLGQIVSGLRGVDVKAIGPKETLEFRQLVPGARDPWRFHANSMSDGTLRALGILVSLFQARTEGGAQVPLVGIEEPEVALHPAAAGVLLDALREASEITQVIVTSHSPDILDNEEIDTDALLAVVAEQGTTKIGPLDSIGRDMMMDHLYTAGELLRQNQLRPDPSVLAATTGRQLRLFDMDGAA